MLVGNPTSALKEVQLGGVISIVVVKANLLKINPKTV